ncbi:hypothetical protein AVEN_190995-1, partial [Araneus ventricosus]
GREIIPRKCSQGVMVSSSCMTDTVLKVHGKSESPPPPYSPDLEPNLGSKHLSEQDSSNEWDVNCHKTAKG